MKDHFSWISELKYTYSHWAFDIVIYLIYSKFNFTGIYFSTIMFAILINIILYIFLNKLYKNSLISLFLTVITAFLNTNYYVARAQIISYLCFIIEIYCLEKYIDTSKKRYFIIIIIIGIILANFHAAAWPLIFILFLPYLAASFFNYFSEANIYTKLKKLSEKKLSKLSKDSPKYKKIEDDINIYEKIINNSNNKKSYKITKRSNYNTKKLIILMLLTLFTGFITPIHNVPFTYILNSMFGNSNLGIEKSINYIIEMKPIIPASNLPFLIFIVILIEFLLFLPTKLKLEHAFLILGLLIMAISSNRYLALLIFLGSYVIANLINQAFLLYVTEDIKSVDKLFSSNIIIFFIFILCFSYTSIKLINKKNIDYVSKNNYPIDVTNYILENIDYKNMRIYNNYNIGSYLMLNNIPVFIDSRLDVYSREFNNTDVFRDCINITLDKEYYENIFTKYNFTHILLKNDEIIIKYLKKDDNYKIIYEDEYFTLFERKITNY